MRPRRTDCVWVLAGTDGAGKSSVGGALLRQQGGDYFNPDEVAQSLRQRDNTLDRHGALELARAIGLRQLDRALSEERDYFLEATFGEHAVASRLRRAASRGTEVRIWYVGLATPELHMARIRTRARRGGLEVAEPDVRSSFDRSRRELIELLPELTELKVFDNSNEADPVLGGLPELSLLLHWRDGAIVAPTNLSATPAWARPIVAQAIKRSRA